jgi:malate dehydrogenase (oxaloacetate-decarboxylating)
VDCNGLLIDGMPGIEEHQVSFVRSRDTVDGWTLEKPDHIGLHDVIRNAKATVLIGVSAQPGAFDKQCVDLMLENTPRPIVFALSNPTSRSECRPELFYEWTDGQGLMACGSPFPPVIVNGREFTVSQGNNLYIFPGVGLGTLVSGALKVTDTMFMAASYAVSGMMSDEYVKRGSLLPPLAAIREVSHAVATAVACKARDEGIGLRLSDDELSQRVREAMWTPKYLPYRFKPTE